MKRLLLLPAALLLLSACDGTIVDEFERQLVVESYQLVDSTLAPVFLIRNTPVGATFDRNRLAVTDAQVEVLLLADDGSVEARYRYVADLGQPGRYRAADADARVLPLRRYRLEVQTPEFDPLRAETVTPGRFEIRSISSDVAVWNAEEIVFNVTRPAYPTRQAVLIFTTTTQREQLSAEVATAFYRAAFESTEDDDDGFRPNDLRTGSSPLINEGSYSVNPDGTLQVELPWIAVPFYGKSRVFASAVDDNLFDFLRSQAIQGGGSTLSPGEIPNVLDRVEGGVGVFGSLSRVSQLVDVRCRPALNFGFECPSDSLE
jgi:hypothetical protein